MLPEYGRRTLTAFLLLLVGGGTYSRAACPLSVPACTSHCTINWTDPSLTPNVTPVRAVHVDELRDCINWARGLAGLDAYAWNDSTITVNSTKIRAVHITDMRTAISQVCAQNGQSAPTWTDPVLTPNSSPIRAVHINELRNAITTCEAAPQCYACQSNGTGLTCGIATAPQVAGVCPSGYSTTQPSLCYAACYSCTIFNLTIDAGHSCTGCGTACGSIPYTCWNPTQHTLVTDNSGQQVDLWGICPYCPAPPSCWTDFGFGNDPSSVATACSAAVSSASNLNGRSLCGSLDTANYGGSCSCSASCVTVSNPVCP
jgi:hypothetical protein